jgi:predicted acetyltransferase
MKSEKTAEKIKLIAPSKEMRNRVMDFRTAFLQRGEKIHGGWSLEHQVESFDEWLAGLRDTPEGFVPSTTYMAVRLSDNAVVGIVNIRHYLTDAIYHNGHIGYSVHPAERRKGYGSEILRLALIKAEQLGIMETVVTCNYDNRISKRVIEKNGLSFQKQFIEDNGNTVLIYTTQID